MPSAAEPALPASGSVVSTACGGLLRFDSQTEHALYRGRRIFFCLPSCKQAFEQDPKTSCLAVNPAYVEET